MAHSMMRRRVLQGALAAAALSRVPFASAQGAFPSGTMRVIVPTGQGGGADRLAQVFDDFWASRLNTQFEYQFMAGNSGQAGYEAFVRKMPHDGQHLLFGNIGPEMIMYALQNPSYKFPQDYQYFCRLDVDDSVVFTPQKGKLQTLRQVIDESKKRTVTVAVSRLPHPASIGVLALGRAVGGSFKLVAFGGGAATVKAVLKGECDVGALPIAAVLTQKDTLKVVGIFNDDHKMAAHTDAPSVNKVAGTHLPSLPSSRSWAVHTDFIDKRPNDFELLENTAKAVIDNPKFREEYAKTGAPVETVQYGNRVICGRYANHMVKLAQEYRDLLLEKKG